MDVPLHIAFKDMDADPELEAQIRSKVDWLGQFSKRIVSCRVTVEVPHHRLHGSSPYNIKIQITMPAGGDIIVDRNPPIKAHEHFSVALRDAANSARRQLETWEREHNQRDRQYSEPPNGRIVEIVRDADYGFIAASDGREVYFHRNSVANGGFDSLEIGHSVHFSEAAGDKGPQATYVQMATRGELG